MVLTRTPTAVPVDLVAARRVAVAAAEEAGALLRARARGDLGVRAKGAGGDVVTELDVAAERLIIERVAAEFPDHRFFAEESGDSGSDGRWVWVVDPLDGTNNLAIGLPAYVVGISLCEKGVPMVAAIHDPVTERTWSAIRGRGARGPGGHPLQAARAPARRPVLSWTQGYDVASDDDTVAALKLVLERNSRRILQLWAPLLGWAMLARGDIDGFVGYRQGAVDLYTGTLIAAEAGVTVCDLRGNPFDERIDEAHTTRSFVAGSPHTVARLLDLVDEAERIGPRLREATAAGP